MAEHIHPVDLPASFYHPIGQIMVGWNLTEALLSSIIWHVHGIDNPKVGRMFTYRATAFEKMNLLKVTLANFVSDEQLKQRLYALCGEADHIRDERNTIAHGIWGRMPEEPDTWKVFFIKDRDDTYKMQRKKQTLENLNQLAGRVRKLNQDLERLMKDYNIPPL